MTALGVVAFAVVLTVYAALGALTDRRMPPPRRAERGVELEDLLQRWSEAAGETIDRAEQHSTKEGAGGDGPEL